MQQSSNRRSFNCMHHHDEKKSLDNDLNHLALLNEYLKREYVDEHTSDDQDYSSSHKKRRLRTNSISLRRNPIVVMEVEHIEEEEEVPVDYYKLMEKRMELLCSRMNQTLKQQEECLHNQQQQLSKQERELTHQQECLNMVYANTSHPDERIWTTLCGMYSIRHRNQ